MTFEEMKSAVRAEKDKRKAVLIKNQYDQECKEVRMQIAEE